MLGLTPTLNRETNYAADPAVNQMSGDEKARLATIYEDATDRFSEAVTAALFAPSKSTVDSRSAQSHATIFFPEKSQTLACEPRSEGKWRVASGKDRSR